MTATPPPFGPTVQDQVRFIGGLGGQGFDSTAIQANRFTGFDRAFFPSGFTGNPEAALAPTLEFEANRAAMLARRARHQDAIDSLQQGFNLLQSFRPGGATALASGLLQNQAQTILADAQDIQAPDLMFMFRENVAAEERARQEGRQRRAMIGNIIGTVAAGAATIASGGAAAPALIGALGSVASQALGGAGGPIPNVRDPGSPGGPQQPGDPLSAPPNITQPGVPEGGDAGSLHQQGGVPGVRLDMIPGQGAQQLAQGLQRQEPGVTQPAASPQTALAASAPPSAPGSTPPGAPESAGAGTSGLGAPLSPISPQGQAAQSFASRGPMGAPVANVAFAHIYEQAAAFNAYMQARISNIALGVG
jgi:hypothetical protein